MTTTSVITIGELVDILEKSYDPEDFINIGKDINRFLVATKGKDGKYTFYTRYSKEEWHCLNLPNGTSKVCDVLKTLKEYIPEHKDKSVCTIDDGEYAMITNNFKTVKLCKFESTKTINDLPLLKLEESTLAWKKFEEDVAKFKEHFGKEGPALLPIAQFALVKTPEIGQIYCVSDTLYHTYDDVKKVYPELTDSKDDHGLFVDFKGVKVCVPGDTELKNLCSDRRNPKFVTNDGELTKDELLLKYNITESQIDKLFHLEGPNMKCKIPELLSELQKV